MVFFSFDIHGNHVVLTKLMWVSNGILMVKAKSISHSGGKCMVDTRGKWETGGIHVVFTIWYNHKSPMKFCYIHLPHGNHMVDTIWDPRVFVKRVASSE